MWLCYFTQEKDLEIEQIMKKGKILTSIDTQAVNYELEKYKKYQHGV
jgi:hypothetical protein